MVIKIKRDKNIVTGGHQLPVVGLLLKLNKLKIGVVPSSYLVVVLGRIWHFRIVIDIRAPVVVTLVLTVVAFVDVESMHCVYG